MRLPAVERVVVVGDVHGDLERLAGLLRDMHIMNDAFQWTAQPQNTIVVQTGDQVDSLVRDVPRAADGGAPTWERTADVQVLFFMEQLDREARRHGGRVISLLGNHEVMNVFDNMTFVSPHSMALLGGPQLRAQAFQRGGRLCRDYLAHRPAVLQIGRHVFCHAGLLPSHLARLASLERINALMRRTLLGEPWRDADEAAAFYETFLAPEGLLWTRQLLDAAAAAALVPQALAAVGHGASVLVVGHSVMPEGITRALDGALWFVDTGMSRAFGDGRVQALVITADGDAPYQVLQAR